jgi:outer membrane protein OmpA-like peptidoglycan-associated protein
MTSPVDPSSGTPDGAADGAADGERWTAVTVRRRARRPLGRLFWVGVLVVPLAMAGLVGWSQASALEGELASEVGRALRSEGLKGVEVVVDGRRVTAAVPTGRDPQRVVEVASAVAGVMAVETHSVYASRREARACANISGKLDRVTRQQRIGFTGTSTRLTAAGHAMVREAARLLTACRAVDAIVGGHVDSSTRDPGSVSLQRARVLVRALVAAGVARDRLEPRGYGDQFELRDETTPAARAQNQRGSITVEGP